MFKSKTFKNATAMLLAFIIMIGVWVADIHTLHSDVDIGAANLQSGESIIDVSFTPGNFPMEATVPTGERDVAFFMYVTAISHDITPFEPAPPSPYPDYPPYQQDYGYDDEPGDDLDPPNDIGVDDAEVKDETETESETDKNDEYEDDNKNDSENEYENEYEIYADEEDEEIEYEFETENIEETDEYDDLEEPYEADEYDEIDDSTHGETPPSLGFWRGLFNWFSFSPVRVYAAEFDGHIDTDISLWWYQNGVRRTDKGVTFLFADSTSRADLWFDYVSPSDTGEWTLRAYNGESYTQSPYTLNLTIEEFIPIMPLSGARHYVGNDVALSALLPITDDITIVLTDSFTMPNTITIPINRHVTLISDGLGEHILTAPSNSRHFNVMAPGAGSTTNVGGNLTLGELNNEGANSFVLQGNGSVSGGGGSINFEGVGSNTPSGILTMYGGTIRGNHAIGLGGAVRLGNNSSFNMHGGLITGNISGGSGGGVGIHETTTQVTNFTMWGGEISGNDTTGTGGGVRMHGMGTFTMHYGAVISGNDATGQGGGVSIVSSASVPAATFNMHHGAVISGNTTSSRGGGVFIDNRITFNMHGGEITGNTANGTGGTNGGGGVATAATTNLNPSATFNMHNGLITNNTATAHGGGIFLGNNSVFIMHYGTITGNQSNGTGGGIAVQETTSQFTNITIHDGEISGNFTVGTSSGNVGGGVRMHSRGTFTMHGGLISGNTAMQGGGVAVQSTTTGNNLGATFNMLGGAIRGNTAYITSDTGGGGGVFISGISAFSMGSVGFNDEDTVIIGNTANSGGGVHASGSPGPTLTMWSGQISNNITPTLSGSTGGGGVLLLGTGTVFTMWGGAISGNVARYGGGIRVGWNTVSNAIFHMHGGEISDNTAFTTGTSGGGVHLGKNTEFNMYDGAVITRNHGMGNGGGIATNSTLATGTTVGTRTVINMHGGEISYNQSHGTEAGSAQGGGGVFLQGTLSIFNMYGGLIHRNQATHRGGGVSVRQGTFNMHNGIISENIALTSGTGGGGVQVDNNSTMPDESNFFNMYGGIIRNNISHGNGGGIATRSRARVNISNANVAIPTEIYGNEARGSLGGGGVLLQGVDSELNMLGGTIRDNRAVHSSGSSGGGVRVEQGTFTMEGGTIRNNEAINGGGVRVHGGALVDLRAVFNMQNGEIRDNIARNDGGGVWVNIYPNARISMTGGSITGNEATTGDGGGIFASPTRTESLLPLDAYQNIMPRTGTFLGIISGNTAGGGLFPVPINYADFAFGEYLTNYQINYRTTWRVVFDPNGGNVTNNIPTSFYVLPTAPAAELVIGANRTPIVQQEGYIFAGWHIPERDVHDNEGNLISEDVRMHGEVVDYLVDSSIVFVARWVRIIHTVTFIVNQGGAAEGTTSAQVRDGDTIDPA
ncbi:MAG: hypothetical protein FWC95_05970, partial [Defluviitaleaceae bacterium]|nr:hypothetical protein [Defluviitaleaceae bacterium]